METPKIPYFDTSKFNMVATGSLFAMFGIFGVGLANIMSRVQCSKTDVWVSVYDGLMWAIFPVLVYVILKVSPYIQSEFSNGVKFMFSWTGYVSDQAGDDKLGLAYALVLTGLIMTTWMIHAVEVSVCKPDIAELASFQVNLLKELKEKQANKQ